MITYESPSDAFSSSNTIQACVGETYTDIVWQHWQHGVKAATH